MRTQEREVRNGSRIVTGVVNPDGTINATSGPGFSVVKAGVGSYNVYIHGFKVVRSASVLLTGGGFVLAYLTSPNIVQVNTYATSTGASDIGFEFMVDGLVR